MADLTGKPISELTVAGAKSWVSGANDMDSDLYVISRPANTGNYTRKLTGQQLREFVAPLKTFYSVAQIGQSSGATVTNVYASLPTNSIGIFPGTEFAASSMPNGSTAGTVFMYKSTALANGMVFCNRQAGHYRKVITTSGAVGDWQTYLFDNTFCYKAGDTVTLKCAAYGRVVNSGQGLFLNLTLDKPITASSFSLSNITSYLYTIDGTVTQNTSGSITYYDIVGSTISFVIPITTTATASRPAYAEFNTVTITFS